MPEYTQPPTFTTGQVLGRSVLGILRDNDDYFNAIGDRYRPAVAGMTRGFIGTETDPTSALQEPEPFGAWDGYMLLPTDARTLYYYFKVENSDATYLTRATMYYAYGTGSQVTIATQNGNGTSSGTYDLSSFSNGIHRIFVKMWRDDGNYGATSTVTVRAPYVAYTGSESYTAGYTITDGNTSNVLHFNRWGDNDKYFNAISPRQVGCAGLSRKHVGTELTTVLFDGWTRWHPDHDRLYYSVVLTPDNDPDSGSNEIRIWFDYDDTDAQVYTDIATSGTTSTNWDIPTPSNYTKATLYRMRVELRRTDGNYNARGVVRRLHFTAPSLDASYTVMDPFTVNQWVYGSTAGQDTRLQLLTDNDASIYDRLAYGTATPGRADFACYRPRFARLGGVDTGTYYFKRRSDLLYYRTLSATLTKPNGDTESLTDYDANNAYQVLDLNDIDVPYGGVYYLSGDLYAAWEF